LGEGDNAVIIFLCGVGVDLVCFFSEVVGPWLVFGDKKQRLAPTQAGEDWLGNQFKTVREKVRKSTF